MVKRSDSIKDGHLDPVKAFKEIRAAEPKDGVSKTGKTVASGYEVASNGFKKFAGAGGLRASRFADSAPVAVSNPINGDTHRVHRMADALSKENPTDFEGKLLAMALIDSMPVS